MNDRRRSLPSRCVRYAWFAFSWALACTVVCALLVGIYVYKHVDEEIRGRVQEKLAEHFSGFTVTVGSARLLERQGFEIHDVSISKDGPDVPRSQIAHFEQIRVHCKVDIRELLAGRVEISRLDLIRPSIRAVRYPNGAWNIARLLSHEKMAEIPIPRIVLSNASLELVDMAKDPASLLAVSNIDCAISPHSRIGANNRTTGGGPNIVILDGTISGNLLRHAEFKGTVDVGSGSWSIRGKALGLEYKPELRRSLPMNVARHFEPLGSLRTNGSFDYQVSGNFRKPSSFAFDVQGRIEDGRLEGTDLSYPVTNLRGRVSCNNDGLRVTSMNAQYGKAKLTIKELACGLGGDMSSRTLLVDGDVTRLEVDEELIQVLPENLRTVWDRFRPLGTIDARFSLGYDGRTWRRDIHADCRHVAISYHKFPYRLDGGRGRIDYKDDRLSFDFHFLAQEQPISVRGDVQRPGPNWVGTVSSHSKTNSRIPIDDRLIHALKPRADGTPDSSLPNSKQRIVKDFRPHGTMTYSATLRRQRAGALVNKTIDVDLYDCSIQHRVFPYPLQHVNGHLHMENEKWWFENLVGYNDSAKVRCHGHWHRDLGDAILSLDFDATDVPLEDELKNALKVDFQRFWEGMRPHGTFDQLTAKVRYNTDQRVMRLMDVDIRQDRFARNERRRPVTLKPVWFPYKMENVTGRGRYINGEIQLSDLHANHGAVEASIKEADGQMEPTGAWHINFHDLAVDRLSADRELTAALPPPLRRTMNRLKVRGQYNVAGSLGFVRPSQRKPIVQSKWNLAVVTSGGGINCGLNFDNIHGEAKFAGGSHGDRFHSSGSIDLDSVLFQNIHVTGITSMLWIDNDKVCFGRPAKLRDHTNQTTPLGARALGGTVRCDATVWLDSGQFDVDCGLSDAVLSQVVREVAEGSTPVRGRVNAKARIGGTTDGLHTLSGNGWLTLRDAEVFKLPVMVSMLDFLNINSAEQPAFTTSDARFRVNGQDVYFDQIKFGGDAISLEGKGSMSLKKELDLYFFSIVGRESDYLTAFLNIIREASRQILRIHVTGTIDHPTITHEVLPYVNEGLQSILPEVNFAPDLRMSTNERSGRRRTSDASISRQR